MKITPSAEQPFFYTVRQFCTVFAVGKTRAYALIRSGAIEAVKSGARTLITTASATRWAAALPPLEPPK